MRTACLTATAVLAIACTHLEPLSNAYSPFARDLNLGSAAAQPVQAERLPVLLADLIAAPERYHRRHIRTEGYITLQFEGNRVCMGIDRPHSSTCLWLDVEGLKEPGFRKGRGLVEGIFDGENLGHFGAASGAIEQITELRRLR